MSKKSPSVDAEKLLERIGVIFPRLHQPPTVRRIQPNHHHPVENLVPESYFIGMGVYQEVEHLIEWLAENPKRKTIPRSKLESFLTRVVDILPAELKALQLMDEKMLLLSPKKAGSPN